MNSYKITALLALLTLVAAIPIYVISEPGRLAQAQLVLRQEFVSDAAEMYVENCAVCHGAAGEGIGPLPPLDNPTLWTADYDFLFKTIARGRYDTAMAGWHVDEGGIYNDYQVDELIALIRYVDWSQVGELAAARGLIPPTLPVPQVDEEFLAQIAALGPEGSQWAEGIHLYANNCTVCHGVTGEGSDLGLPLNTEDVRALEAAELARTIAEGVPGTAMVAWKNALSVDDVEALVSFLKNWDVIEANGLALEAPEPIRIDLNNPEEVLALGERIYSTTCIACHGDNGSGGTGPALNSQQILSRSTDEQLQSAIVNGGLRPNSTMPAFGGRLTSVEIGALVDFIRAWEPTATWVANPRGTAQGGGPPWLQATPDASNPLSPGSAAGSASQGSAQGGGPPWRQSGTEAATPQADQAAQGPAIQFSGQVVTLQDNLLTFASAVDGALLEAMLGPPWFWSESGIPLTPGDQIALEGFQSTDHLEVNWLANQTTGQRIELRTAAGVPVWTAGN